MVRGLLFDIDIKIVHLNRSDNLVYNKAIDVQDKGR